MKLIWTYSEKLQKGKVNKSLQKKQIHQLYHKSIECGSKFYKTCIYTTVYGYEIFKGLVDEIVIVPETFNYTFLADLKFHVIEKEQSPFILIDGDLFIQSELKIDTNCDFAVEYEILPSQPRQYLIYNKYFIDNGIKNIIPYWKDYNPSYNLGLIYVNNKEYSKLLVKDYYKVKEFYNNIILPNYDLDQPSVTGAQYFFNLFCTHHNLNVDFFKNHNAYTHLAYDMKYSFDGFKANNLI